MNKIYITIFLIAFILRLYFIVYFPALGGDGDTYKLVAMNILSGVVFLCLYLIVMNAYRILAEIKDLDNFFIAIIWAVSEKSI